MATTRRDIELLITAKETTGRSFKQVTSNIDALNAKIGEQIAQAERGEISLRELRQTQEQLAQAGRDLSALQGQIDAYNRLVATSDKVAAAAEKAKTDLAALQATIEASGKATARQESQLQRLEVAVERTGNAVAKNNADMQRQAQILQQAGIETKNLDTAQAGIVNNARQIGAGLQQVNAAIDGYSANVARARQEEQNLAAQQGFERKIAEARRLGDAARFVQLFGDAINTVKTADNQMQALTGFRAVGQMAAEASRDMSQFVQTGQTMAATSQQVAAGLRAIIDPGAQALRTLDGVEAAIKEADAAAADGVKNVALLNDAYNQLAQASAALLRQGSLVDTFRQQEVATNAARQQFQAAQADVQRLGAAMAAADEPTEQLARALAQAEGNLEKTGRALAQEESRLGTLSRELREAGIASDDLAAAQGRLEGAAERVNGAMNRINQATGRGGMKTNGLFGLRPHELANLSYQINDIFVSLASGQKPLMVLVQQGSQIGQIFPGLISTVARFALAWAPVILVLAAVGLAIRELYTDMQRLDAAGKALATTPFGENIDVQRFADAQEKLEGVAKSADEARKILLDLVEEGFSTDQIEVYSESIARLSDQLGISLTEAAKLYNDVAIGGIESVYKLAEETNRLTDAEIDHAEALFNAGKAAEARQYILDAVADRNRQIAEATESQWTPAVNNLKKAWENFVGWLGRVFEPFAKSLQQDINNLVLGLTYVAALLAGKGFAGAKAEAFGVFQRQQGRGPKMPGAGATNQSIRDRRFGAELDAEVDNTRKLGKAERLARVEREARARAQRAGASAALEERAVTQALAAENKKMNEEAARAAKKSSSARSKAAREAKAAENQRQSAMRQLNSQLRQLNRSAFSGVSATLEERLEAIDEKYESIYDTLKKMRSLGITTGADGRTLAQIEAQVEATKERLKAEETIKFYQDRAAVLDKQRSAEIERITTLQTRGAISTQEAMQRAAEVNDRLSPGIRDAAQHALTVARALAGAKPTPEMISWIASLERIISGEETNRTVADVGLQGFEETKNKLDTYIRERDELVQSYSTLYDLGILKGEEVRQLTASAYRAQAEAIRPVLIALQEQAALLNATIDPLTKLPVLSDAAYGAFLNKIDEVNKGLTYTDARLLEVQTAARNAIQNGVVTAFQAGAKAIVGLIAGTQSFGDAIKNLGTTALSIFGSILDAIAQVLVQMVALQFVKSLIPGGGGSGFMSFLFSHDGGMVGSRSTSRKRLTGASMPLAAPKMHNGGMAGLNPDEYHTILRRGEEVLTDDNPRHINNIGDGSGGGQAPGIKQVLYLDPSEIAGAMQTRSGMKSILTVIRANKETIKQVLA